MIDLGYYSPEIEARDALASPWESPAELEARMTEALAHAYRAGWRTGRAALLSLGALSEAG